MWQKHTTPPSTTTTTNQHSHHNRKHIVEMGKERKGGFRLGGFPSPFSTLLLCFFYSELLFPLFLPLTLLHTDEHTHTNTDKLDKQRGLLKLAYAFAHFIHHSSLLKLYMLCVIISFQPSTNPHPAIACARSFALKRISEIHIFLFIHPVWPEIRSVSLAHAYTCAPWQIAFCAILWHGMACVQQGDNKICLCMHVRRAYKRANTCMQMIRHRASIPRHT